MIDAVRDNRPYNEVKRAVESSLGHLAGSNGRPHRSKIVTYDEILNSKHEFAPNVDKMTKDGPAPVMPDANGLYPIPQPGIMTQREY